MDTQREKRKTASHEIRERGRERDVMIELRKDNNTIT